MTYKFGRHRKRRRSKLIVTRSTTKDPTQALAPGAKVFFTPCPPGWQKIGETPGGGKICWPKPGTAVVHTR